MWNECKGFIATMAIMALATCLIIIGMFIEREASNKEIQRQPDLKTPENRTNESP